MPGAPGILSMESPRSAITSTTRSGGTPENFFYFGRITNQIIFRRVQDEDFVVDQLHHVLVAGDDIDRMRGLGSFARQGADYVVGFESREFQDRNAIGLQRAPDVGHLLDQILRHGCAVGFVSLVFDFGEGLRLDIELTDFGDGVGLLIAERGSGDVEDGC